jgi:hypothetical protein
MQLYSNNISCVYNYYIHTIQIHYAKIKANVDSYVKLQLIITKNVNNDRLFSHFRSTTRPRTSSEMQLTDMMLQNVHHLHVYLILALEVQRVWSITTSGTAYVHQGNNSH